MTIESPLSRYSYFTGDLIQACDDCDWAQAGHKKELVDCPECGARLGAPLAIQFGGNTVIFDGTHFEVYSSMGGHIRLFGADYADLVAFMCRHGVDDRPLRDWGSPRVRRVLKTRCFTDLCMDVWRS